MLSTLAFFLVGITVLFAYSRGKRAFEFRVDAAVIRRDLTFFIFMYGAAIFIPLIWSGSKFILAGLLVIAYFVYVWLTVTCVSRGMARVEELYFGRLIRFFRRRGKDESPVLIVLIAMQVICSLAIMVGGAHLFVEGLEKLSSSWGISPLLFALLAAPVATELPEKFNSVTWTLKGKDALAAGNITGAMVFQSAFPVSLGLVFTDWTFSGTALLSAVMALAAAIIILAALLIRKRLSPVTMMSTGFIYLTYVVVIILKQ
jgi:cation:H+ antiporter